MKRATASVAIAFCGKKRYCYAFLLSFSFIFLYIFLFSFLPFLFLFHFIFFLSSSALCRKRTATTHILVALSVASLLLFLAYRQQDGNYSGSAFSSRRATAIVVAIARFPGTRYYKVAVVPYFNQRYCYTSVYKVFPSSDMCAHVGNQ